ncbi:MAG TPA: TonB-dependent receptor plug domain-containing protein, partial [Longimicrobiales bacterium]
MKAAAVLLALLPALASAQVRDTTPHPPRTIPYTLPALDVRASRSAVPPERLPYAVQSLIPSTVSLTDATAVDAALGGIAGVQVANRFNDAVGERLTLRGMGARAQFGIRGVRVSVDGIPATMPDGQTTLTHLDVAAITAVDVLRGPASALWGNAAGGVVTLRTTPLLTDNASVHATAGSHGMNRVSAGIALTPGDASAVNVRATRQEYGGFRTHASSLKQLASAAARWAMGSNSFWVAAHAVDYDALNPGSL